MVNGKKIMFLETCTTGTNVKMAVAEQNARQRLQIPTGFFPYDSRTAISETSGRRESPSPFFGGKKEDKKPLAVEHVFIAGVI